MPANVFGLLVGFGVGGAAIVTLFRWTGFGNANEWPWWTALIPLAFVLAGFFCIGVFHDSVEDDEDEDGDRS